MFGLFFAALCGAGLYRMWRPRHFAYGYAGRGFGGGCGHRGFGRFGGGRHHGGSPNVEWLIHHLNANQAQEAALRQSADEIFQAFRAFSPRARMDTVSAALISESFEREHLLSQLREPEQGTLAHALVNAVERLRPVLDADQRKKLAALLVTGGRRWQ